MKKFRLITLLLFVCSCLCAQIELPNNAEWLVEPKEDSRKIHDFRNQGFWYLENGKVIFLSPKGERISEYALEPGEYFIEGNGILVKENDRSYSFIIFNNDNKPDHPGVFDEIKYQEQGDYFIARNRGDKPVFFSNEGKQIFKIPGLKGKGRDRIPGIIFKSHLGAFSTGIKRGEKPTEFTEWVIINGDGEVSHSQKTKEKINLSCFSEGVFKLKTKDGIQFIDVKGKVLIQNIPGIPFAEKNGLLFISMAPGKGLLGTDGSIISEAEFSEIIYDKTLEAWSCKDGEKELIYKDGRFMSRTQAMAGVNAKPYVYVEEVSGKLLNGIKQPSGNVLVPAKYSSIEHLEKDYFLAFSEKGMEVLDPRGKQLISGNFDRAKILENGKILVREKGIPLFHFYDKNGNQLNDKPWSSFSGFSEGMAVVAVSRLEPDETSTRPEDGEQGIAFKPAPQGVEGLAYINENGEYLISGQLVFAFPFFNGAAKVITKNMDQFYIDPQGVRLGTPPAEGDYMRGISDFLKDPMETVPEGEDRFGSYIVKGKFGLTINGKKIGEPIYDKIYTDQVSATFEKDGMKGVFSKEGKPVSLGANLGEIGFPRKEVLPFESLGSAGIIDLNSGKLNERFPFNIKRRVGDYILVEGKDEKGNKVFGVLGMNGKMILPLEFEALGILPTGETALRKNGKTGILILK